MRYFLALALPLAVGCQPDPCEDPGTVCAVAGNGVTGYAGDDGDALEARFYRPMDVVVRPGTGGFAVVDFNNHRVRYVDEEGLITTIVGTAMPGDGPADQSDREEPGADGTTVALNHPVQVEWGPDGKLYLPNWHNHKVRTWDPATGKAVVIVANTGLGDGNGANAGFAGDGGPAEDALQAFPNSIAFGPDGEFYVLEQKNLRVREVRDGIIDSVAGSGTFGFAGDGGDPMAASFAFVDAPTNGQPDPGGAIEVDADGVLYVTDTWNDCVRRIDLAAGVVESIAMDAEFSLPRDVEIGPDGRLYVMDTGNFQVRAIDLATGDVETVLGTGSEGVAEDGALALEAPLGLAYGIDFADDGALLVADTYNERILRVTP